MAAGRLRRERVKEMYDRGKVIPGILIFLAMALFPLLHKLGPGEAGDRPVLQYPAGEKQCIEPKQFMRENHMQLLFDWRETVVRGGNRVYRASDGREYNMSITGECLGCHDNKTEFCDRCHDYLKVRPYCWDCHTIPKGKA